MHRCAASRLLAAGVESDRQAPHHSASDTAAPPRDSAPACPRTHLQLGPERAQQRRAAGAPEVIRPAAAWRTRTPSIARTCAGAQAGPGTAGARRKPYTVGAPMRRRDLHSGARAPCGPAAAVWHGAGRLACFPRRARAENAPLGTVPGVPALLLQCSCSCTVGAAPQTPARSIHAGSIQRPHGTVRCTGIAGAACRAGHAPAAERPPPARRRPATARGPGARRGPTRTAARPRRPPASGARRPRSPPCARLPRAAAPAAFGREPGGRLIKAGSVSRLAPLQACRPSHATPRKQAPGSR